MGAIVERCLERSEKARLMLEEVERPVLARVAHRNSEGMTVKHELPFLRLDTGVVDDHGRRATIRRVDMAVENGTPNLVLDLVYEESARIGLDDTIPAGVHIAESGTGRRDQTLPLGLPGRAAGRQRPPRDCEIDPRGFIIHPDELPPVVVESERAPRDQEEAQIIEAASEQEPSREKPSFASRARALAMAIFRGRS